METYEMNEYAAGKAAELLGEMFDQVCNEIDDHLCGRIIVKGDFRALIPYSPPADFCRPGAVSLTIVYLIPLRKLPKSFPDPNLGGKAVVAFEAGAVRIGGRYVAGLHADELPVAFEIKVLGQDACADEFLLESGDIVKQVLGCAAADVVDGVGRQREAVFAGPLLRRALHDAEDALDDVVDVGEVALHIAVVEDLNGLAGLQFLRGGEIEHVRAAGGTVNGEEPQACGRNIVELAVAVRQKLIGLFGGRVEGDRVVDLVFYCEGHLFVAAVHGGAGGIDEVLDAVVGIIRVPAGLEDVVESDQVALDVDVRMVDGVADAGLRGEIDDDRGLVYLEYFVDEGLVGNASLDEDVPYGGVDRVDHVEPVFLELRVVVVVHVVEADHGSARELAAQAHDQAECRWRVNRVG